MLRVAALFGMSVAGLIGLVGVAVLLYGGYLGAIVTEDGNIPYEAPALLVCLVGMAVMGVGIGLGKLVESFVGEEAFDPLSDLMLVIFGVGTLAVAAFITRVLVVIF